MIIRYTFVTGEVSEVEVTDEGLCETLVEVAEREKKINRKESRRHTLMSVAEREDGMQFKDETVDIEAMIQAIDESERLRRAMECLTPGQWALIHQVYVERRSIASVAHEKGVSAAAVHRQMNRAFVKIRKNLKGGG